MPTVEWNTRRWNNYEWTAQGEEWSEKWGDSEAQWFGAIFPRIHRFLPATSILEIAPGFGRWTGFLKHYGGQLTAVDLAASCIEACKQRFASESNVAFHQNDGKSLTMVPDRSIDFVFSFDSLVHVEADVIEAYLNQLASKLTPEGAGFIHHSNLGEHLPFFNARKKIPRRLRKFLTGKNLIDGEQRRGRSMTAEAFARFCGQAGLQCIGQEKVNWGTRRQIDCFSTFTRKGSSLARANLVVENPNFMREAEFIRATSGLYSGVGAAGPQSAR